MSKLFLALTLFAIASVANAQHFGLREGMPINQAVKLTGAKQDAKHQYLFSARRVPAPHPVFSHYYFRATPKNGLCMLGGLSEPSVDKENSYNDFNELKMQLEKKYGSGVPARTLGPEFAEAIDRMHMQNATLWSIKSKSGRTIIALDRVETPRDGTFHVALNYYYALSTECSREISDLRDGGL